MRGLHRALRKAGLIGLCLVAFASTALAVKSFSNGKDYLSSVQEYQDGYTAGAFDMLSALQDAGLIAPGTFNDQTHRIVDCAVAKKLSELRQVYIKYLNARPDRKANNAASSIYLTIKANCRI